MSGRFRVIVLSGAATGFSAELGGIITIGRQEDNTIALIGDPEASRRHARVEEHAGFVVVSDLGSSNGTSVNGVRISAPVQIRPGDLIQIGSSTLTLEWSHPIGGVVPFDVTRPESQLPLPPGPPTIVGNSGPPSPVVPPLHLQPSPAAPVAPQVDRSTPLIWGGVLGAIVVAVGLFGLLLLSGIDGASAPPPTRAAGLGAPGATAQTPAAGGSLPGQSSPTPAGLALVAPSPSATSRPVVLIVPTPTAALPAVTPTPGIMSPDEIVATLGRSTVYVMATLPDGLSFGTGFIIDDGAAVVTSSHVVEGASALRIGLPDRRTMAAQFVGRAPCDDLVVLRFQGERLPPVRLGNSSDLQAGDELFALGYTGSDQAAPTLTLTRSNLIDGQSAFYIFEDLLRTDSALGPGTSGGPLVNVRGEVVGVNTLAFRRIATGRAQQGTGYAVAMAYARPIVEDLIRGNNRQWLGANLVPDGDGLRVAGLVGGGPFQQALFQVGDRLTTLENTRVRDEREVCEILRSRRPGDILQVTGLRGREQLRGSVRLGQ